MPEYAINESVLELIQGDITKQNVDVIVNAANSALCGGGGVDGAIHRAAGPSLMAECRKIKGGCPTGQAVITGAGNLPAKQVIHTVGPVWDGGDKGEEELLASAYRNSLTLAHQHAHKTIAFPSISTGVYRFPIEKATQIAINEVQQFLKENPSSLERVVFVTFSDRDFKVYQRELDSLGTT